MIKSLTICSVHYSTIISNVPAPAVDYEMETTTIIQQVDSPQPHVTYITQSADMSPIKIPASPGSPNSQNKQKHPQNMPYDPFVHTNNKPPLSFSSLIFLAIEDAKEKALPVKEIYSWIIQHYPYFKTAPTGWKNSVRHNLSLNKCFQKVEKAPVIIWLLRAILLVHIRIFPLIKQLSLQNMGKGSLWRVEQQYKQNLIQALSRSSYHPGANGEEKFNSPAKTSPRPAEALNGLKVCDSWLFRPIKSTNKFIFINCSGARSSIRCRSLPPPLQIHGRHIKRWHCERWQCQRCGHRRQHQRPNKSRIGEYASSRWSGGERHRQH